MHETAYSRFRNLKTRNTIHPLKNAGKLAIISTDTIPQVMLDEVTPNILGSLYCLPILLMIAESENPINIQLMIST
jgi:hypothetical protein